MRMSTSDMLLQELEQAGIKPLPLAHLPETADAEHGNRDSACMLTQLTYDSSTLPAHLVLLACLHLQLADAMQPIDAMQLFAMN